MRAACFHHQLHPCGLSRRRAAAALLLLSPLASAVPLHLLAGAPIVTWASAPLEPGQTLLVAGANLDASCEANLSTTSAAVARAWAATPALPGSVAASGVAAAFLVPASLPADAWTLTLRCAGGASSAPALVNVAEPWWAQGDLGATASAGGAGWLRVAGLGVAWLPPATLHTRAAEREAARALRRAAPRSAAFEAALAALLLARGRGGAAAEPSTVRLTPVGGGAPVDLTADAATATQFAVQVAIPASLAPGTYNLSVSNGRGAGPGGAFAALDSFYDPATPHVRTVTIEAPPAWPPGVFTVGAVTLPAPWPFNAAATSDGAVAAALAAARAAGGGTIAFPPGTYFLTQPLIVPPGVALQGAGANASVIYFAEATNASAPAAYFALDDAAAAARPSGTAAWAVRDLSVVITGFHFHVFAVSNFTDGWALERVTLRANAFFANNDAGTVGVPTHGRYANWTLEQPGTGIQLNARNFRIVDCDLWTTYNAISSYGSNGKSGCVANTFPNSCHGATFGYVAGNTIHHGGASHFMNQWRQVIYERNVHVGASVIAMGQSVGTGPDGGHDHHILHADNEVAFVWGNDRELLTFDDAGGAYFGAVAAVDGATLTTAADTKPPGDMTAGGWAGGVVVILNGTGAGQWRRIVVPGTTGSASGPSNRTWVLADPWAVDPDATSFIQITPFRGRNIFSGDLWADGGAFQYYGQALDNILVDATVERITAVIAWGQWRGWVPVNGSHDPLLLDTADGLGGQMGNGIMPNLRNQYLRNTVTGSWGSPNYNYSTGYDPFYARRFFAVQPLGNAPANISATFLLVYRDNVGGGGYSFGAGSAHIVVDGGAFQLDAGQAAQGGCVLADPQTTTHISATGVVCTHI